jgi:hypothetical protein
MPLHPSRYGDADDVSAKMHRECSTLCVSADDAGFCSLASEILVAGGARADGCVFSEVMIPLVGADAEGEIAPVPRRVEGACDER